MLPRTDARGPPDVRFVLSRMGSVQAAPDARPLPPLPPPALPYVPAVEAVSPAPRKRLSGAGPGAADVELAGAAPDSEDVPMAKRHQTRANASRRQLTADTVLHSLPDGEVIPDDAGVSCDEDDGPAGQHDHAGALLPAHNIEIPNIVTLEEGGGREPMEEGNGEEEDVSDARMARLHLVYEIKVRAYGRIMGGVALAHVRARRPRNKRCARICRARAIAAFQCAKQGQCRLRSCCSRRTLSRA